MSVFVSKSHLRPLLGFCQLEFITVGSFTCFVMSAVQKLISCFAPVQHRSNHRLKHCQEKNDRDHTLPAPKNLGGFVI